MIGLNKEVRSFDIKLSEGVILYFEFIMYLTYMKIIR